MHVPDTEVPCPSCRASAGEPCSELRGGIHGDARRGCRPHADRIIAAAIETAAAGADRHECRRLSPGGSCMTLDCPNGT